MSAGDSLRITDCTHRPTCPGCPHYGRAGMPPGALDRLERLAQQSGATVEAGIEGEPIGNRHRSRLMVRGRARSPKIGLFQRGTHRIADIPDCGIHHPLVNTVARAAKAAIRETGAEPYADGPHRGLVRALQVVVERATQSAQVVVIANAQSPDSSLPLLDALARRLDPHLHSLWWNGNPERSNTVIGPLWKRVSGAEAVRETIGSASVFFPPGAFGQGHLELADRIVARIHDCIDRDARVTEFYAGSGAIGLGLLRRGQSVTFNELGSAGLQGLELGISRLPATARNRAVVIPGAAGDCASIAGGCGAVIVDPPRKGLDAALRDALASQPPERLVYLSCDLGSLTDDAAALLAGGQLALTRLVPYALFPFTDHFETLAVFDRV